MDGCIEGVPGACGRVRARVRECLRAFGGSEIVSGLMVDGCIQGEWVGEYGWYEMVLGGWERGMGREVCWVPRSLHSKAASMTGVGAERELHFAGPTRFSFGSSIGLDWFRIRLWTSDRIGFDDDDLYWYTIL